MPGPGRIIHYDDVLDDYGGGGGGGRSNSAFRRVARTAIWATGSRYVHVDEVVRIARLYDCCLLARPHVHRQVVRMTKAFLVYRWIGGRGPRIPQSADRFHLR